MAISDTQGVLEAIQRLRELLARAREVKQSRTIEPPLPPAEFHGASGIPDGPSRFAAVELAARQVFEELVVGFRTDFQPYFANRNRELRL
jgi:hypothetical protein